MSSWTRSVVRKSAGQSSLWRLRTEAQKGAVTCPRPRWLSQKSGLLMSHPLPFLHGSLPAHPTLLPPRPRPPLPTGAKAQRFSAWEQVAPGSSVGLRPGQLLPGSRQVGSGTAVPRAAACCCPPVILRIADSLWRGPGRLSVQTPSQDAGEAVNSQSSERPSGRLQQAQEQVGS